jgi:hypothetical protein
MLGIIEKGTSLEEFKLSEFIPSDAVTFFAGLAAKGAGVAVMRAGAAAHLSGDKDEPAAEVLWKNKLHNDFHIANAHATYTTQPAPQPQGPQPVLTAGSGLS